MKSEMRKSSSRHKSNYISFRKSTFFPHEQILDEMKKEPIPDESVSFIFIPNCFIYFNSIVNNNILYSRVIHVFLKRTLL
jgi:hypothetical protein